MKLISIFIIAVVNAAPIVVYPNDKEVSDRVICGSWMMKTDENVLFKFGDSIFKPNVEYSTSSLIGQTGKITISNTDEKYNIEDFYNMMNYDENRFIIWSIDGSIKFYNCMKQDEINPKFSNSFNETLTTITNKNNIDVKGCMNNIDCINIHCQDMIYVKETLKCYPKTENGNTLGYYISKNNDW